MDFRIVRGRWLQLIDSPQKYVALPFGVGLKPDEHEIRYTEDSRGVTIEARPIGKGSRYTVIYPAYTVDIRHQFSNGKTYDLVISTATTDDEYLDFQLIIGATHYLSAPKSGMFIGCRFKTFSQEKEFLSSTEVARHAQKPGGIFACVVAQTMFHGNPNGRSMVAENALGPDWKNLSRPEIVGKLGLAWGSRFAVDDPYIRNGIGTLLAKQLAIVVRKHRLPPASFVEVIRTVTKERCEQIIQGQQDWLTKAGYKVYHSPQYARPIWKRDAHTGNRIPPQSVPDHPVYRKLYYLR